MFTGIVQDIGRITAIDKKGDWVVTVATNLPLTTTAIGASIAHSGICLTVIEILQNSDETAKVPLPLAGGVRGGLIPRELSIGSSPPLIPPASGRETPASLYKVHLSEETLSKTTAIHWQIGTGVNLETALRAGDELGGHYVSGHVDGIARVVNVTQAGDSWRLLFDVPPEFARFIAAKGSITIDGVSLTVNHVEGAQFGVTIIPHTQKVTTLGGLSFGDETNFEIDMIARYLDRMRSLP